MTKTRLEAFSDGVFSITITLLILNVKIPDVANINNGQLNTCLVSALPNILSFIFTFLVVGVFWVAHHRIFVLVKVVNSSLLWLNLLYLMVVAMIPFPASILAKYPFFQTSVFLYTGTLLCVGAIHVLFLFKIYHHRGIKNEVLTKKVFVSAIKLSLIGPACYVIAALGSFINTFVSFAFIATALVFYIFFAGRVGVFKDLGSRRVG